jgi:hypothetical protein
MKRFIPWILGVGVVGGGLLYWKKKKVASAKAVAASTADLIAAKSSIAATTAIDEVKLPVDKRLTQAEKDTYAFQLVHQDAPALYQTANELRGKSYTGTAEGFVLKADKMVKK